MKRQSISITDEQMKVIQKLKKKYYDKTYSEILRMILELGLAEIEKKQTKQ